MHLKSLQLASLSLIFSSTFCFSMAAQAQAEPQKPSYLLAQAEVDDSYDPFSDYSEFDEASDEEADINFFRHGT